MSESCDSGQMMSHVMQVMSHDRPVVKYGGHLIMAKNIQLEKLGVVLLIEHMDCGIYHVTSLLPNLDHIRVDRTRARRKRTRTRVNFIL